MTAPRARTGLVVGRFDPPHLGHSYLIERAAGLVDALVVYVNSRRTDAVDGALRAGWLAELHRDVTVVEVRHDLDTDFDDEELWARWIELFRRHWPLGGGDGGHTRDAVGVVGPDVVCSSDAYVDELARRLGARAVVVDAARATVPVSATMVREDPAAHLHHLAPPVREWVQANWVRRDR